MTAATATRRRIRAAADTRPFAAYGRISKRKAGDGMGATVKIEDQQEQGSEVLISRHGEGIQIDLFQDNMSAWDPEVYRPSWEALLADLRSGKYRGVIALNGDRFTRQPIQIEILWKACQDGGAELWTVTQGQISDPTMLRIEGALSARESDIKSKRMKDHHVRTAEAGKPHGGRRRFGYEDGMTAIKESEATFIRQAAARVLAGETLASVARWMNEEGAYGPEGGRWAGSNLSKLLVRPHLVGDRHHLGEIHQGAWDPILDRATHENLVHLLSDSGRRTTTTNARVYLLAGLAKCAACGLDLRGRPLPHGKPGRAYACLSGRHCHRPVEIVDQVVQDRVVARLRESDAAGALVSTAAKDQVILLEAEQSLLEERLDTYGKQNLRQEISDATFARQTRLVEAELERVAVQLGKAREVARKPEDLLRGMTGPDPEVSWQEISLGRQRAILEFFYTIELRGAETRRAPFRATDVVITPKEQD